MRYNAGGAGLTGSEENPLVSVVIPTFNEAEVIERTIAEVSAILKREGIEYEIIVVDDNSPDGTWRIVEEVSKRDPRVRLYRRIGARGLSTAILDGIKFAKGKYVVVMDADLQHPPRYLPQLIRKALNEGYEIVVASRYARGGGVAGWSRLRLMISKGATLLAKLLVKGARKTSDPMSGFFLVRRDLVLSRIEQLRPRGYKVLLEILARIDNARVGEVPYVFEPRRAGKSKLGFKVMLDYIIHVIELSQLAKFAIVGAGGTVVNLAIMYLLLYIAGLGKAVSSIAGIESGLLWNFVFNEVWTFEAGFRKGWLARLAAYHASSAGGFLATFLTMYMLSTYMGVNPILGQFIGILVGFIVNYVASSRGVWRIGGEGQGG
ncbi:MAG: glycosyltransferase family 2 protein [Desulfurococcales archaeon]|nr:glycosyltransferase family 2 protein [Desulfurococcales archaeon]